MLSKEQRIKLLKGALEVLEGGKRWIKNEYQLNGDYCLAGAMFESAHRQGLVEVRVIDDDDYNDNYVEYTDTVFGIGTDELGTVADAYTDGTSLTMLAKEKGFANVPKFNDDDATTYGDIEKFVNERIARIEQEPDV